jgi:hypothetical protein
VQRAQRLLSCGFVIGQIDVIERLFCEISRNAKRYLGIPVTF